MRYRDAGVDISRADAIKDEVVREIARPGDAEFAGSAGSPA
jgi:hypothetical protein